MHACRKPRRKSMRQAWTESEGKQESKKTSNRAERLRATKKAIE